VLAKKKSSVGLVLGMKYFLSLKYFFYGQIPVAIHEHYGSPGKLLLNQTLPNLTNLASPTLILPGAPLTLTCQWPSHPFLIIHCQIINFKIYQNLVKKIF